MANVMLGSDPESFVMFNGLLTPATGLLPGTKEAPHWFNKHEAIQIDGLATEWNVKPSKTFKAFSDSIDSCMNEILRLLPEGYSFSNKASHIFTEEQLAVLPAEALELGCSPDFNAVTGMVNTAPVLPVAGLRSAGGHISIDIPQEGDHEMMCRFVAVAGDYYMGLPSLFECDDTRRREIYGKASCYRPYKKFVEYRTLSNYWVFDMKHRKAVFDRAQRAATFADEEKFMALIAVVEPDVVAEAINNNDKDVAIEIMKELKGHGF